MAGWLGPTELIDRSSRSNGRASSIDVSSETSGTAARATIVATARRVPASTDGGSIGSLSSSRSSSPS